jgi:hypothetical protein
MKKYMLMSLVIAFLIVTVASSCFAQTRTVASTSKKGSLLIFPLIRTDYNSTLKENWETLVTIANDYALGVWLTCVVVKKDGCDHGTQIGIPLTANQVITFRASDGRNIDGGPRGFAVGSGVDGEVAEAKCWATRFNLDEGDTGDTTTQIQFNHLSGEATLLRSVDGQGVGAASYNAWRFAANKPNVGDQVGPNPGELLLTGVLNTTAPAGNGTYDACPASLLFDFLRQTPDPLAAQYQFSIDDYVAMVPCKQDLTQDGGGANIKIDVTSWDENESPSDGAICLQCFSAGSLADAPYFPDITTPGGVFQAYPHIGSSLNHCIVPAADTYPVVGVIVKRFGGFLGPITATTPTGKGTWVPSSGSPNWRGVPAILFPVH